MRTRIFWIVIISRRRNVLAFCVSRLTVIFIIVFFFVTPLTDVFNLTGEQRAVLQEEGLNLDPLSDVGKAVRIGTVVDGNGGPVNQPGT